MPLIILGCGIVWLLILILLKVRPLFALLIASVTVGLAEGMNLQNTLLSIGKGVYSTLESMLLVLLLGAMLGKLIETTGAARRITQTLISKFGIDNVHWAVMLTGLLVGIPLFYNAGFVILVPLIFSISLSANIPILVVAIPMAASLSVTHGFLPPHPGPVAVASIFHADVGKTLVYGLAIAIPTVVLAGPLFARTLKSIKVEVSGIKKNDEKYSGKLPPTGLSFAVALLPVFLIAISVMGSAFTANKSLLNIYKIAGNPSVAIGVACVMAVGVLAFRVGKDVQQLGKDCFAALKEISLIILIIAAGGGFKQVLIDSRVGDYIADMASGITLSPLFLAWSITAALRVALGSATVAGLTGAGIALPLLAQQGVNPELMVLAVGSGSLMFSHVNDTGFWMFKEYFNLSLSQTFRSWTLMETIISVSGLAGVLLLDQII